MNRRRKSTGKFSFHSKCLWLTFLPQKADSYYWLNVRVFDTLSSINSNVNGGRHSSLANEIAAIRSIRLKIGVFVEFLTVSSI